MKRGLVKNRKFLQRPNLTTTDLPRAKSAMDFRAIFPERVLGKASTPQISLNAATGPTSSRTN